LMAMGQAVYQQGAAAPGSEGAAGADGASGDKKDDTVIDAEFTEGDKKEGDKK
jgi:hypothetical protein